MKLGYSLGILAALLFVFPSISEARQGEPPRSCMRNGYVDCSIHGCQRYCNNGNNRHNGHRVNPAPPPVVRPAPQPPVVRPAPQPPVVRPVPQPAERVVVTRPIAPPVPQPAERVVVTRPIAPAPVPVPAPAPVVVTRPIAPAPAPIVVVEHRRSKQEIKREIKRLERENDRLEDQLEEEERRAEYEYDFCLRSVPVYVANRCVYDDSRIREIKEDIRENKREIRDLKDEKRGW